MTEQAALWRAVIFFGLLAVLIVSERLWRRKKLTQTIYARWMPNFSIFIVGSFVTRALVVVAGLTASLYAARQG